MTPSLDARLKKLEARHAPARPTHEDMLARLDSLPPVTAAESAALDARIEAEAIAEHGSLAAAAIAARAHATRSGDFVDGLIAEDLESRAQSSAQSELFQPQRLPTSGALLQDEDRYRY